MGNLDRRAEKKSIATCAVCGASDARTLAMTRLEDGTQVTVCGSHKIAHRRAERLARTIEELRLMLCDRRVASA